jgi:hypothetical protein
MKDGTELIEVRSQVEGALLGFLPAPAIIPTDRKVRYRVRWPHGDDPVDLQRRFRRLWVSCDYEIVVEVGEWVDAAGARWCLVVTAEQWERLQLAVGFLQADVS